MNPDTDTKSDIIAKIQKLLALSKSSNQHEAEVAAKRASELMEKYQIAQSVVEASSIKSGKERVADMHFEVPDLRMKYQWVVTLGHAAAKLFDGTILVNRRLHGTGFVFVGFASEIPAMRETFLHFYHSWKGFVERDLEHAKDCHVNNPYSVASWAPRDTMKFKQGHGQGYAHALYARCVKLAEERNARVSAANQSCTALVLVRKDEVVKYLATRGIKTVKVRQTDGSTAGFNAGHRAGSNLAIGGALPSAANNLRIS